MLRRHRPTRRHTVHKGSDPFSGFSHRTGAVVILFPLPLPKQAIAPDQIWKIHVSQNFQPFGLRNPTTETEVDLTRSPFSVLHVWVFVLWRRLRVSPEVGEK